MTLIAEHQQQMQFLILAERKWAATQSTTFLNPNITRRFIEAPPKESAKFPMPSKLAKPNFFNARFTGVSNPHTQMMRMTRVQSIGGEC